MKITNTQLRRIIREEYLRSTPSTRPGRLMSEARANMLAEQILDEGVFSNLAKALFSGLKAGGSELKSQLGDKAAAAWQPISKKIGDYTAKAREISVNVISAIAEIKDEAIKKAAEAARESIKTSVTQAIKKSMADGIQMLVKAGMEEEAARGFVAGLVSGASADAVSGGNEG